MYHQTVLETKWNNMITILHFQPGSVICKYIAGHSENDHRITNLINRPTYLTDNWPTYLTDNWPMYLTDNWPTYLTDNWHTYLTDITGQRI